MDYADQQKIRNQEKVNELKTELPECFGDFLDYLSDNRSYSSRSVLNYATDLSVFTCYLHTKFGAEQEITPAFLDTLTPDDIDKYISWLNCYTKDGRQHVNGERGKARKLSSLRSMYRYLMTKKGGKTNPAKLTDLPKQHRRNVVALEQEEIGDLLEGVRTGSALTESQQKYAEKSRYRDVAIITLLLHTGIRVSELVGIDLKDIDLKHGQIRVMRKGGNEDRIYINESVEAALTDYMRLERENGPYEANALFISRKGERLSVRSVERIVKKYAVGSVPLKKISPHKLRSSFATVLYKQTGDINLVKDSLNHANLATVNRYVQSSDKSKQKAAKIMQETIE